MQGKLLRAIEEKRIRRVGGVADCRIDQVHSASALLTYRPHPKVTLQASAMHETRSSSVPFGDYVANVIWGSARFQL